MPVMFDDMTTVIDALPFAPAARLRAGDTFSPRELRTLAGDTVRIPDPRQLVHLQMRRYAGCPLCSLHLRSFVRRKDDLARAGVREVAVFHSSAEELRRVHTDLPFDVVPDPERDLYLVAPDGKLIAVKYGKYADDQWSIDELLSLAKRAPAPEARS